jgi:hypothetical protein
MKYMIGQGAKSNICSQTAPPSCCPMEWISSRTILRRKSRMIFITRKYYTHLLIRGVHSLARGGDKIIIARMSGTVISI